MKSIFTITLLLTLSLIANAQRIAITSDKDVDFSGYKSFRVIRGELVTIGEQPIDTSTFHTSIQEALRKELREKGYSETSDTTAHLVVSYVGEAIIKTSFQNVGPLGQQPVDDPAQVDASRVQSTETREGSLVIDITDRANKKVVWRASSSPDINTIAQPRVINAIIAKSLRKFPKRK